MNTVKSAAVTEGLEKTVYRVGTEKQQHLKKENIIKHTSSWKDMVTELPIFIWPTQSCLKHNSCNLFISASNEDVLCCPSRSSQESLPSCGSRGVKIISHTQDKGEYKRLQEVQGTMLEVQQQRGAVTAHTAPWSHCPEGSPKFINLSSDWWTAAYKQVYS